MYCLYTEATKAFVDELRGISFLGGFMFFIVGK